MGGPAEGAFVLDSEHRSPDPSVCPFLRSVDLEDALGAPIEAVDPRNRCIATGSADPQDAEQQRSACLTAAHVRCARYLSGVAAAGPASTGVAGGRRKGRGRTEEPEAEAPEEPDPRGPTRVPALTPAILVAILFLLASGSAAIAFVAVRGGITLPVASSAPSQVAIASPSPAPTIGPGSSPSPAPTATPGVSGGPTATPVATATPVPTATPPGPTPAATSNRYELLTPCPDKPNCYLYTIRIGDNLRSIANYFGVPYQTVLDMNPQITDPTTIQPGDVIQLPPPTR